MSKNRRGIFGSSLGSTTGKGKLDAIPVFVGYSKTERKVVLGHLPPPPQSGPTPVRPRPSQTPPQSGRQQVSSVPVFKSFIPLWALQGGKVSLIDEMTFSWVLPAGLGLLCRHSLVLPGRLDCSGLTSYCRPDLECTHGARSRMEDLNSQWKIPMEDLLSTLSQQREPEDQRILALIPKAVPKLRKTRAHRRRGWCW